MVRGAPSPFAGFGLEGSTDEISAVLSVLIEAMPLVKRGHGRVFKTFVSLLSSSLISDTRTQ